LAAFADKARPRLWPYRLVQGFAKSPSHLLSLFPSTELMDGERALESGLSVNIIRLQVFAKSGF